MGAHGPEVFRGYSSFDVAVMHLNPAELSDLIEVHGVGAELRRSMMCPCVRIETMQPRAGCPSCNGIGYTYPETLRESVIMLLTTRNARSRDLAAGRHYSGTGEATFPLGVVPARGDIIVPDYEQHVVQQVVHRAVQQVRNYELWALTTAPDVIPEAVSLEGLDRLLYPDVIEIEVLSYIDPTTRTQRFARAGIDYRAIRNRILWAPDCGPKPGDGFSVRYKAPGIYIIGDGAPVSRIEGGVNQYPYKCSVERLDRWTASQVDLRGP